MRIILPENIKIILSRLASAGFEGFVVGGCVRDTLIGRLPGDWDVTTSATPDEIKSAMQGLRTIDTGIKHGTVSVVIDGTMTEITAFRSDGAYSDNRHPDSVTFSRNLADDLSRRDFTVNAMAYNESAGLVDLFDGERDVARRVIRCVGDPDVRFGEDALRIMRAVRFASVLGFSIEEKTAESAVKKRALLGAVAVERKRDELIKLLCGGGVETVLREYYPIIAGVVPELHEVGDAVDFETLEPLYSISARAAALAPGDAASRLAVLMRGVYEVSGEGKVFEILCRLRLSKAMRQDIITILSAPEIFSDTARSKLFLGERGVGFVTLAAKSVLAWESARGCPDSGDAQNAKYRLEEAPGLVERGECLSMAMLAINGEVLASEGFPSGRRMGEILEALLDEVLCGKIPNDRAVLLERAQDMITVKEG